MDPSSNVFERLLVELHIIGQIHPGQKLNTQQGLLQIIPVSNSNSWSRYYYSIMRYWYGESRTRMIEHIKQTIQQTIHCLLHLYPPSPSSPPPPSSSSIPMPPPLQLTPPAIALTSSSSNNVVLNDKRQMWGQEALISALRKARMGLENMKQTYSSDASLLAQLDVILLSIDQPLQLFDQEVMLP